MSGFCLVGSEEPSRLLQQGRLGSDLNFTKVIQQQGEEPTSGAEVVVKGPFKRTLRLLVGGLAASVIYYVGILLFNNLNFRNLIGTVAQMHKSAKDEDVYGGLTYS